MTTKGLVKTHYCIDEALFEKQSDLKSCRAILERFDNMSKVFSEMGTLYMVGGAVRDMVQGILPRDVDCTLELYPGKSIGDVHEHTGCALSMGPVVGRNFPVLLHGGCEIAVCHDLYKDAMRRDFTVNAMFLTCKQDPENKDNREILTIPGTWKDLNNGVLRMHGDMFQKFKDDPIRILRALRFAAGSNLIIEDNLHYKIHALRDLIKSPSVPKERVLLELIKGLICGNGYGFVKYLDEYELLEYFFPAVAALKGVDGAHYHHETVYTHVLNALKALDKVNLSFDLKLAALYHDVGKVTHELSDEGKVRFVGHDKTGKKLVEADMKKWGFPKDTQKYVSTLVGNHMSMIGGKKSLMKLIIKLGKGGISLKDFIWMKYADSRANMKTKTDFMYFWRMYKDCLKLLNPKHIPSVTDLAVNGHDVMTSLNIPSGKLVGDILKSLWQEYLDEKIENERPMLLKRMKEIYNEIVDKSEET